MELSDFKLMLGLSDNKTDSLLILIMKNTELSLRFKLGLKKAQTIPEELDYILLEVSIRRFNRLKNEGMSAYSQEGESITFNSDDFVDFQNDIDEWKRKNNGEGVLMTIDPFRK